MATKRFTDAEKWNDKWFMNLSPEFKLAWIYVCDTCDCAGIFELNESLANFRIKFDVDWERFLDECGARVLKLRSGKFWIVKFIEFQQKRTKLNPSNNAHRGVISRLEEAGIQFLDFGYSIDVSRCGATKPTSPSLAPSQGLTRGTGKGKGKGKGNNTVCTTNRIDTHNGLDNNARDPNRLSFLTRRFGLPDGRSVDLRIPQKFDSDEFDEACQRWIDYLGASGERPNPIQIDAQMSELARHAKTVDDAVAVFNRTVTKGARRGQLYLTELPTAVGGASDRAHGGDIAGSQRKTFDQLVAEGII